MVSCALCEAVLPNVADLEAHLRRELDYARWKCRHCAVAFFSYAQAETHFHPAVDSHPGKAPAFVEDVDVSIEAKIKDLVKRASEPRREEDPSSAAIKTEQMEEDEDLLCLEDQEPAKGAPKSTSSTMFPPASPPPPIDPQRNSARPPMLPSPKSAAERSAKTASTPKPSAKPQPRLLVCLLCRNPVPNRTKALNCHVASKHMAEAGFRCRHCDKVVGGMERREGEAERHHQREHPGLPLDFSEDARQPLYKRTELCREAFPKHFADQKPKTPAKSPPASAYSPPGHVLPPTNGAGCQGAGFGASGAGMGFGPDGQPFGAGLGGPPFGPYPGAPPPYPAWPGPYAAPVPYPPPPPRPTFPSPTFPSPTFPPQQRV